MQHHRLERTYRLMELLDENASNADTKPDLLKAVEEMQKTQAHLMRAQKEAKFRVRPSVNLDIAENLEADLQEWADFQLQMIVDLMSHDIAHHTQVLQDWPD